jgi:hypothetical protein
MTLEKPREAWARADRMLRALAEHLFNEQAFTDRLPYVLDLLSGVGRQITESLPKGSPLRRWWDAQWTPAGHEITEMRHAQLKRMEPPGAERHVHTQTATAATIWHGKPLSVGDTAMWATWRFVGGRFDDQDVVVVLRNHLDDLAVLIGEAEARLDRMQS